MQTIPSEKEENLQRLFNRANTLRMKAEFDKAAEIYKKIIQVDESEAEAYWRLVLCKYVAEYVEDPDTYKRIPTCHRTSYDAVVADEDYRGALEHADMSQRLLYEEEARAIDEIQKGILAIAENDYKDTASTDGSGNRGRLPRTSDESTSDFYTGIESSDNTSSGGSSSSSGSSKSVLHTCEASTCNKEGTYSIVGISGETEYYCAEHYAEMNAMADNMENSVGTIHTCDASGCNKTATHSIIGISGQREYYCETHYKEMQDIADSIIGE